VLKIIKATSELRRIPVVVNSTSSAESDIIRAYDSYANSYLVKPGDASKFASMMHTLDSYWFKYNEYTH